MARASRRYLVLKGNKWWFKQEIPVAIREVIGRGTAYQVNLQTGDIRAAMARRDELMGETAKLFTDARAGRVAGSVQDRVRERAAAWAAEIAISNRDPVAWAAKVTGRDPDDVEPDEVFTPHELIEREGESIRKELGKKAEQRFLQIVAGKVAVDHHLEAFLKEEKLAPKTTAEKRNLVGQFTRWAEREGITLSEVSPRVAAQYVTAEIAILHEVTARKRLSALSTYWDFMIFKKVLEGDNPWTGRLRKSKSKRVDRGDPPDEREFTEVEMRTLLYSPFPANMRPAVQQQLHDIVRIAALSGMRLAEIATLRASECALVAGGEGVSHFKITHGKTKAALRLVPIHSDLLSIIKARLKNKRPDEWLFHELAREKNAGDVMGKRFASYRKKVGVDDKRDGKRRSLVNFHSFRRWFITEAERAGQMGHIISAVAGHEDGRKSLAFGTYSGGPSVLQLMACVEAVKLPKRTLTYTRPSG